MDGFERSENERAAHEALEHAAADKGAGPGMGRVWDAMMKYLGSEQYQSRSERKTARGTERRSAPREDAEPLSADP